MVETNEKPILFSTEMVKAILDGRKTMTRRVKGLDLINQRSNRTWRIGKTTIAGRTWWEAAVDGSHSYRVDCPYGQIGDRLWVRESLKWEFPDNAIYTTDNKKVLIGGSGINEWAKWEWRKQRLPSIFMPRWASRINLEITNIRVERLQDITPEDAVKEGAEYMPAADLRKERLTVSQIVFAGLWDKLNAKRGYGWDKNPYVWVIEFRRI